MKEEIRRMNPGLEFYTPELCYINELSNIPSDPGVSIARARVQAGCRHKMASASWDYRALCHS
jgi:hypothetical protein